MTTPFDPDAAAAPGSGLFGLTTEPEDAAIQILAVPFDATTSYRPGTRRGPTAVLGASYQIDLHDPQFGHPYQAGIVLHRDPRFKKWNKEARKLAEPIIALGGHLPGPEEKGGSKFHKTLERVNAIGELVNQAVYAFTKHCLEDKRIPAVLGGDHSVPLGAIQACAEAYPGMGILHIDAHADLRVAFEGFQFSHASILNNVLERAPEVSKVVQIGLRDLGQAEAERIAGDPRITAVFDEQWAQARMGGATLSTLIQSTIEQLPDILYVTFDIDGLDPTLCPNTGTPVPGGILWNEAMLLLREVAKAGKRIIGFDLCEVSPGRVKDPQGETWDAAVGARLLYRLCGLALANR